MIICSCNVISDVKIRACLNGADCPRTPSAVYKCLGCSPNCGRCAKTVRGIIRDALGTCAPGVCEANCPHTAAAVAVAAQHVATAA